MGNNVNSALLTARMTEHKKLMDVIAERSKQKEIDARKVFYIESEMTERLDFNSQENYEFEFFKSSHPEFLQFNIDNPLTDGDYIWDLQDILKVQFAIWRKRNKKFTLDEAANIWQNYSWNLQASWLFTDNTVDGIVNSIESDDFFKSYEDSAK